MASMHTVDKKWNLFVLFVKEKYEVDEPLLKKINAIFGNVYEAQGEEFLNWLVYHSEYEKLKEELK